MNILVLDCSVAVAWFLEKQADAYTDAAALAAETSLLVCPPLFRYELTNALLQAWRRGIISETYFLSSIEAAEKIPLRTDGAIPMPRLAKLAAHHELTAYDAAYLDTAMRNDALLATRDAKLAEAARRVGVYWAVAG